MKQQKKIIEHRTDLVTPLSKRCDWLEIKPLAVQPGSRMFAVREGPLYLLREMYLRILLLVNWTGL